MFVLAQRHWTWLAVLWQPLEVGSKIRAPEINTENATNFPCHPSIPSYLLPPIPSQYDLATRHLDVPVVHHEEKRRYKGTIRGRRLPFLNHELAMCMHVLDAWSQAVTHGGRLSSRRIKVDCC